jgi:UDP-N-acetyl-D-galactosamine dehydrogenase
LVHDPLGSAEQALHEYDIRLCELDDLTDLDGLILAVPHEAYLAEGAAALARRLHQGGVLIDVKSVIPSGSMPDGIAVWSL